jgi:hypothetical protein
MVVLDISIVIMALPKIHTTLGRVLHHWDASTLPSCIRVPLGHLLVLNGVTEAPTRWCS